MTTKLRVTFEDPHAGWIRVTLTWADQTIPIVASYIYDSFHQLTRALHTLLLSQGSTTATWLAEPLEYEMRFERSGETIQLTVREFPDRRRNVDLGQVLLTIAGSYAEICLPFWRALRALQGRFSEHELRERWQAAFPADEIIKLTQMLEAHKQANP